MCMLSAKQCQASNVCTVHLCRAQEAQEADEGTTPSHASTSSLQLPKAGRQKRAWMPAWLRRPWLPAWLRRHWREFNEHLTHDQAFAEAMSRRLDVAAASFLFCSYTVCAILIFAINGSIYGNS